MARKITIDELKKQKCWVVHRDKVPYVRYYLLDEYVSPDLADLMRKGLEWRAKWKISDVFAPMGIQVLRFLDHFNEGQRRRGLPDFDFDAPAYWQDGDDSIYYHMNVLKDVLAPGNTRLVIPETSALPGMLSSMPQGISDLKATDIPGPAALAYAVTSLEMWPFQYDPAPAPKEYNPFSYMPL